MPVWNRPKINETEVGNGSFYKNRVELKFHLVYLRTIKTPSGYVENLGSYSVWPDLVKFRFLGNILKVFGHFLSNYLVFGKIVILLWQIFDAFGKISLF